MPKESDQCLICQRIEFIKQGKNPDLIKELKTGYAVLGWHQYFKGYCLLLYKEHKTELHQLSQKTRAKFLQEMALLAEAVYKTFRPDKLNYELLGNGEVHMHWHIFPRCKTDLMPNQAIWVVDKKIRQAKQYLPNREQKQKLITAIRKNLNT